MIGDYNPRARFCGHLLSPSPASVQLVLWRRSPLRVPLTLTSPAPTSMCGASRGVCADMNLCGFRACHRRDGLCRCRDFRAVLRCLEGTPWHTLWWSSGRLHVMVLPGCPICTHCADMFSHIAVDFVCLGSVCVRRPCAVEARMYGCWGCSCMPCQF